MRKFLKECLVSILLFIDVCAEAQYTAEGEFVFGYIPF